MNKSPSVTFKLQAFRHFDKSDDANFFRCRDPKRNNLDYITRPSAIGFLDDDIADTMGAITGPGTAGTNLGYVNNRFGSGGAFDKNGPLTKSNLKKHAAKMRDTKTIVWAGILSFTPEEAQKVCYNKECAQSLIEEHLHKLFENTDISYDNIEYVGAYHTNTDNPHIHLTFYEREPLRISSSGKPGYTSKLLIPKKNINSFKYAILTSEKDNKLNAFYKLRNPVRNSLRVNLNNDSAAIMNFLYTGKDIWKSGIKQYSRLPSSHQKLIDEMVISTLGRSEEGLANYNNYKDSLLSAQATLINLAKQNNMNPSAEATSFYTKRINELHTRLGNEMLRMMRNVDTMFTCKQNVIAASKKSKTVFESTKFDKFSFMGISSNKKMPLYNNAAAAKLYNAVKSAPAVKRSLLMDKQMLSLDEITLSIVNNTNKYTKELTDEVYRRIKHARGESTIYEESNIETN